MSQLTPEQRDIKISNERVEIAVAKVVRWTGRLFFAGTLGFFAYTSVAALMNPDNYDVAVTFTKIDEKTDASISINNADLYDDVTVAGLLIVTGMAVGLGLEAATTDRILRSQQIITNLNDTIS